MVVDLVALDDKVRVQVLERFDHGNLNLDPLFTDRVPTTENFCKAIFELLHDTLPAGELVHVRVEETENNFFECSARG
jgi:6-pyruvoyltetrahydropterin/6-carboxytetrahydropterin synthase